MRFKEGDMDESRGLGAAFREATGGAVTWMHTLKCRRCGLEFAVYSWSEDWPVSDPTGAQKAGNTQGRRLWKYSGRPRCPECGQSYDFAHSVTPHEEPIFRAIEHGQWRWMWENGQRRAVDEDMQVVNASELQRDDKGSYRLPSTP